MEIQLIGRFLVATGLLLTTAAFGQTSFYKVYSGTGYDKGEGVAQLPDSGFLVTGSSSSFDEAPSQVFLMRLDSTGNFMWSHAYGGPEFEEGKRVMPVPGYGYYIAGTSSSDNTNAGFDAYLIFTDESGVQQWEKYTNYGAWERVQDAILLPDTSIFVVGQTDSTSTGFNDIFAARYDKLGNLLWKNKWGGDGDDIGYAVVTSTDTTVLIGGTWYVEDSLKNKACLMEVKLDGSMIWKRTYGLDGNYQFNDLHKDNTWIRAIGQRIKTGKEDHDIYDALIHFNGSLGGAEEFYIDDDTRYVTFAPYTAGNTGKYFLAYQTINPNSPTYPEGEDCVIARYSSGLYWDGYGMSYSGVGQDQANDMCPTSDGYAVAVGFHTSYGTGGSCVFVVKLGSDSYFPPSTSNPQVYSIVGTPEPEDLKGLQVFPNPVSDILTVKVKDKAFAYTLLDAAGKQLFAGESWELQQLDLSGQPQGVYFLQIAHESGEKAIVKIVK